MHSQRHPAPTNPPVPPFPVPDTFEDYNKAISRFGHQGSLTSAEAIELLRKVSRRKWDLMRSARTGEAIWTRKIMLAIEAATQSNTEIDRLLQLTKRFEVVAERLVQGQGDSPRTLTIFRYWVNEIPESEVDTVKLLKRVLIRFEQPQISLLYRWEEEREDSMFDLVIDKLKAIARKIRDASQLGTLGPPRSDVSVKRAEKLYDALHNDEVFKMNLSEELLYRDSNENPFSMSSSAFTPTRRNETIKPGLCRCTVFSI
ncbi:hypothetical protein JCM16303_004105 [Sporobolomyces ruberrimus]